MCFCGLQAQESKLFTIDELFSLAVQNNHSLNIAKNQVKKAEQEELVQKQNYIPNIDVSADAYYLSDATTYEPDFSNKQNVAMPHFGNSFIVEASQLIYKGGSVRKQVQIGSLQKEIAQLQMEKNQSAIKLLVAGYYLQMLQLYNKKKIYEKNLELFKVRHRNIVRKHEQGMVTSTDVIRSKLQISNLDLSLLQAKNDLEIINDQLAIAVGLPRGMVIIPDTSETVKTDSILTLEDYQLVALSNNPELQVAHRNVDLANKATILSKTGRIPSVSLYAANSLSKPILQTLPVVDEYTNVWQAGVSVGYNLSSIYKSGKQIRVKEIEEDGVKEAELAKEEEIQVDVNKNYLKYFEALKIRDTNEENIQLAAKNYEVVEKKYLNQLALFIDVLDAGNAMMSAELQYSSAQVNVLFSYYCLLNATGQL